MPSKPLKSRFGAHYGACFWRAAHSYQHQGNLLPDGLMLRTFRQYIFFDTNVNCEFIHEEVHNGQSHFSVNKMLWGKCRISP